MLINIDADIVKGDVKEVTLGGTVILNNVVLSINTGAKAKLNDSSFRSEIGTVLSSAQIVVPTITMTREHIYSLPVYMQTEIRKKADELKKKEARQKGSL